MQEWKKENYLSHDLSTETIPTCKPKFIQDVGAIYGTGDFIPTAFLPWALLSKLPSHLG